MIWLKAEKYDINNGYARKAYLYNANKKALGRMLNRSAQSREDLFKVPLYKVREEKLNSALNKSHYYFVCINNNPDIFRMYDEYMQNYAYVSFTTARKIARI